MRYTAEQITPKRNPENKPKQYMKSYWTDTVLWAKSYWGPNWFRGDDMWDTFKFWFIDIPNAPEELKPLAYPENKPSEDGVYVVHDKNRDAWV